MADIKACIFDLDGTLADTLRSIAYCGNKTLERCGYEALPEEQYRYYAGDGAKELVRRFLYAARSLQKKRPAAETAENGRSGRAALSLRTIGQDSMKAVSDADAEFETMFRTYQEIFAADCMYEVRPYDGIPELLAALKARGIKTAVLSNKPHAQTEDVVLRLFGESYFDRVQGQKDGLPKKPAPDGALRLAAEFGVSPKECLYAGDTDTDMQTGTAAGMLTAGVLWGFRRKEELLRNGAQILAETPLELLNYLSGVN